MEKFIFVIEITDPFQPLFGAELTPFDYVPEKTLRSYLEEHYNVEDLSLVAVYINQEEQRDFDITLKETDSLVISYDLGWFAIPMLFVYLTEMLSVYTMWTVATIELVAGIMTAAIVVGGLLLVYALLAPDMPDSGVPHGQDTSKAYQWGDTSNTSKQMIPIPVGFGRFKISGNLIAARTEQYNYNKAGFSIRETIYLLFSLVGNKLHKINDVTINNMQATSLAKDDVSVYYTYGSNTQAPLDPEFSHSFVPDDEVAPASDGPLFPDLSREYLKNLELEAPVHTVKFVSSYEKLVGYTPGTGVDNSDDGDGAKSLFTSHEKNFPKSSSSYDVLGGTLYSNITAGTVAFRIIIYHEEYNVDMRDTRDEYEEIEMPCFAGLTYRKITDGTTLDDRRHEDILLSSIVKVDDPDIPDSRDRVYECRIDYRSYPQVWPASTNEPVDVVFVPAIPVYETVSTYEPILPGDPGYEDAIWNTKAYSPSPTYTIYKSANPKVDNLLFQFTYPKGLYHLYSGSHSGKDAGVKFPRWESYEIILNQYVPGYTTPNGTYHFIPPDELGSVSTIIPYQEGIADCPKAFYIFGSFPGAHTFTISAVDIIKGYQQYPHRYTSDGHGFFSLTPNNVLPKGYEYELKVRIYGHGNTGRKNALGFYTSNPNETTGESRATDYYETRLYRITEVNYDETLSYPNNVLLGIALNATPTINGQMPSVVVDCEFEITYYDGNNWITGFSNNPAHIFTAICYDNLWGAGFPQDDIANLIDLDKLTEFAEFCAAPITNVPPDHPLHGEPNYTFNGLFDTQMPLWDVLTTICAVANARPFFENGKITVYWEDDIALHSQVFNNTNIVENTFTETFVNKMDIAHSINGSYIDEHSGEKTALTWTIPLGDPKKSVNVELVGVTNYHRALRAVHYKLNKTNILKKVCSFTTTTTALNCQIGDKIIVQNEFVDWGNSDMAGLVRGLETNNTILTLDRLFPEPPGTNKYILFRRSSDDYVFTTVINSWDNSGERTVITVDYILALQDLAIYDPFIIGVGEEAFRSFIISTLNVKSDLECQIDAIEYFTQQQVDTDILMLNPFFGLSLTKEKLCPRNIKLSADLSINSVFISFDPPLIAQNNTGEGLTVLRYQIWRRGGIIGPEEPGEDREVPWQLVGETVDTSYTDENVPDGELYFYKVLPIFSYHGIEASMPLSWCVNFIDSGNDDLDKGVDLRWSTRDFLPFPQLLRTKLSENRENPTLCDYTFFLKDPKNWETYDPSEGYGIWVRLHNMNDTEDFFGPTTITLTEDIDRGATSVKVSSTSGLTIPGLVLIGHDDLVYVTSASSNTLFFGFSDPHRRFAVGRNHNSSELVFNAHKGFYPIVAFGFVEDLNLITDSHTLEFNKVFVYEPSGGAGRIIETTTLEKLLVVGSKYFTVTLGVDNTITGIANMKSNSLYLPGYDAIHDDFSIGLAWRDYKGLPIDIFLALWNPAITYVAPIKQNSEGELYFTIEKLPREGYCWVAINRYKFNVPIGEGDTFGWTSHIFPIGV